METVTIPNPNVYPTPKPMPYDKKVPKECALDICPKPKAGSVPLAPKDYNDLLYKAIAKDACAPPCAEDGEVICKTYTEKIVIPCETEVTVPVEREVMKPGYKKQIVKGTRLVPKQKWKPVDEKHIEVKEEICRGTRTVWKAFEEEYCEVIKKPVEIVKTRFLPFTEFCEEEVDVEVEVPCDRVQLECGHRIDKKLTSQVVEVEKQEYFKMVPTRIDCPPKYTKRVIGKEKEIGVIEIGKDIYDDNQCILVPPHPKPDPIVCAADVKACPDGTFVSRDPALGCEMPPCPGEEMEGYAAPPVELEYKHLDAASFTSSSRPATREVRRMPTGYGNRPSSRGAISQLGDARVPLSRGGSFDRPVSRQQRADGVRDRPPTGALFQGADGRLMVQPSAGQAGRMHASALAAMAAPQQARLKTPYTQGGAPSAQMPRGSQAAPQRLVVDNRPGTGSSRLGRSFGNGQFK